MTPNDMLDLALGRIEPPDLDQFEAECAADPETAERMRLLSRSLNLLLDDEGPNPIEPPFGLAHRTILLVAAERQATPVRRSFLDYVPARFPFGLKDLAVAASVLLCTLATLMPAMHRHRAQMDQASCGYNLQQLGVGLFQYASINHIYPYIPDRGDRLPAGTYALMLNESGLIHDPRILHCPCNGPCPANGHPLPRVEQVRNSAPEQLPQLIDPDYAYHVGYRQGPDRHVRPIAPWGNAVVALLADAPPIDAVRRQILEGNSPNHGGRGQNVLFSDGHIRWISTRRLSPDDLDIYLNNRLRSAPGLSPGDSALVPATFLIADPVAEEL